MIPREVGTRARESARVRTRAYPYPRDRITDRTRMRESVVSSSLPKEDGVGVAEIGMRARVPVREGVVQRQTTQGKRRFGKKRSLRCECDYQFTCRACLAAATARRY